MVDDDQQLASALQWILADENYLVDVAFDGDEALLKVAGARLRRGHLRLENAAPARATISIFRRGKSGRLWPIVSFSSPATRPIPTVRNFLIEQEVKFLVKPFPSADSCVLDVS